jgi:hypothetical protein
MILRLEVFLGPLAAGIQIDFVRLPLGHRAGESPRIMKGRPFESKFSWVVAAT